MKINECSCGCGGMVGSCESSSKKELTSYMFFGNLNTIRRNVDKLLSLDPEYVDQVLSDGHDWANDHIATSKDDIEEVMNFFINEKSQDSRDHTSHKLGGMMAMPFARSFESFTGTMNHSDNSLESFIHEFFGEFPEYDTVIDTNKGTYAFTGIKFSQDKMGYILFFEDVDGSGKEINVKLSDEGPVMSDPRLELSRQSQNLVNQMLRFNLNF